MTPTTSTPRIRQGRHGVELEPEAAGEQRDPPRVDGPVRSGEQEEERELAPARHEPQAVDECVEHPGHAGRHLRRDRPQERLRESHGERAVAVAEHEEREERRERERHDHPARPEHPHARRAVGHRQERHDEQHAGEESVGHALDHDRRERGRDPQARALGDEVGTRELSEPERQDDERHEAHRGDRVQPGERQLRDGLEEDPQRTVRTRWMKRRMSRYGAR